MFIVLAIPIIIQNFMASTLNLVDNLMIGRVGDRELSAVGQANQYFNILCYVLIGLSGGAGVFAAQFWGVHDTKNIKKILRMTLITGGAISVLFTVPALVFPGAIISIFTNEQAVITLGSEYLRIAAVSYPVTAVTFALAAVLRSCGSVKLPMAASVIALLTNTALNYLLIFGNMGMPMLGVKGAAAATLIARIAEVLIISVGTVIVSKRLWSESDKSAQRSADNAAKGSLWKRFLMISMPIVLNEGIWGLGAAMYAVVFGRMGADAYPAYTIAGTIERMAWILILGVGAAGAVVVGQVLGRDDKKSAYRYAVRCGGLAVVLGLSVSAMLLTFAEPIVGAFNMPPNVLLIAKQLLFSLAAVFVFKSFNYTSICGYFRAGGDTRYCMFLDIGGIWLISVPLMFFFGLYLKTPVWSVFLFANFNEVVNSFINGVHLRRKKWMNNINKSEKAN